MFTVVDPMTVGSKNRLCCAPRAIKSQPVEEASPMICSAASPRRIVS